MSSTISAIVVPIGTSTSPVFLTLPTRQKILVPALPGVPTRAYASAPTSMMTGTLAHVSTLLIAVGLPVDALLDRERRALARLAHLPLDRAHQRGLLAADEGAGAAHQVDVEDEAGAEDVLAEQPELAGLAQGDDQVLDGQRVLVADVDDALGRAGGEGADQHPLDDAVRVALEHRAVHVGAGVALVGVADEELAAAVGLLGEQLPLEAGREAGAAAAAQPRPP